MAPKCEGQALGNVLTVEPTTHEPGFDMLAWRLFVLHVCFNFFALGNELPIGPKVVPFWGSYLEFYKVIPKRNYFGAYG